MAVESYITTKEFYIPEIVCITSGRISHKRFHLLPQEKNAFTGTQDIKREICSNNMKC